MFEIQIHKSEWEQKCFHKPNSKSEFEKQKHGCESECLIQGSTRFD